MTKAEIQRRYTERHPDRIKESQKKYNLSEKSNQRRKRYYKKHHSIILEKRRTRYKKNPDKELEYAKKYSKINYSQNRDIVLKHCFKYTHSEKGIKKRKEWYEKNRENRIEYRKKYRLEHPDKVKTSMKKYRCSDKGHQRNKRGHAKAKNKRWIRILPNIFPKEIPFDDHHIDGKLFVVPLPKKIHQKSTGRNLRKHIEDANGWVEFFYGMDPLDFITDEHSTGQHPLDTPLVSPVVSPSPLQGR
jgi:hypothetical protein